MNKCRTKSNALLVTWTILGVGLWSIILVLKVLGTIKVSWLLVILIPLWVPLVIAILGVAIVPILLLTGYIMKLIRKFRVARQHIRGIKKAKNPDSWAIVYGTRRQEGETDEQLKARLLQIDKKQRELKSFNDKEGGRKK